jgi:hypothetical protein
VACFLGKRNLEVVIAKLASSESKFVKRPEITVYFLKSQVFKVPTLAEIEKGLSRMHWAAHQKRTLTILPNTC